MDYESKPQPETLKAAIKNLGLSIRAEFVPWTKSRHAKPTPKISDRNLNWRVTLVKSERDILTTDYSAGIGHCPSYPKTIKLALYDSEKIEFETERGKRAQGDTIRYGGKPILPETHDVIHSLVMDSDVIDYSSFEDWASTMGYDPDSRSAEKIYKACLKIALELRNGLGEDVLAKLREASQDY